jgi:hypothetical protein
MNVLKKGNYKRRYMVLYVLWKVFHYETAAALYRLLRNIVCFKNIIVNNLHKVNKQ